MEEMSVWLSDEDASWGVQIPCLIPGAQVLASFLTQFSDTEHCGRQQVIAQIFGCLPAIWEAWVGFLAPGFGLAQWTFD